VPDLRLPQRSLRLIAGATAIVGVVLGGAAASLSNTAAPATTTGGPIADAAPVGAAASTAESAPLAPPLPLQVGAGADVLVLGDSLAVALYPYLGAQMPDRRVTYAAQEGRATAWAATRLSEELRRGGVPRVLVVSSGTNDGSDADVFRSNAERVLNRAGEDRCVVWLTVHVPDEETSSAINAEIDRLGERNNVAVADWADAVEQNPGLLIGDGVHATAAGLQVRAELIVDAVHRCSPYDPDAPPPAYVPPPTDTRMPAGTTGPQATSAPATGSAESAGSPPAGPSGSSTEGTPSESATGGSGSATSSAAPAPGTSAPGTSAASSSASGTAGQSIKASPAAGG